MRILGLSSFQHDTAAAVLEDGVVKAAIENDKLARARTQGVPEMAIHSCLQTVGAGWDNIDLVAVAGRPLKGWLRKSLRWGRLLPSAPVVSAYHEVSETGVLTRELTHLRMLRRYATGSLHKVISFDHHLCHAASAFFLSPFEQSLIITMDEDGDGNSMMLGVGEGNRIRKLCTVAFPDSLAWFYSRITDLIGFRPGLEEHKTQWLSRSTKTLS
jgi:carbamoyltransferase